MLLCLIYNLLFICVLAGHFASNGRRFFRNIFPVHFIAINVAPINTDSMSLLLFQSNYCQPVDECPDLQLYHHLAFSSASVVSAAIPQANITGSSLNRPISTYCDFSFTTNFAPCNVRQCTAHISIYIVVLYILHILHAKLCPISSPMRAIAASLCRPLSVSITGVWGSGVGGVTLPAGD